MCNNANLMAPSSICVLIFVSSCLLTTSVNAACSETPADLEKVKKLFEEYSQNPQFGVYMYTSPENTLNVDMQEYRKMYSLCIRDSQLLNDILNFKFLNTSDETSEGHLSTCPWVTVENMDEDRFPSLIYEAQCLCRRCLKKKQNEEGKVAYQTGLGVCKPITSKIMTVRRACDFMSGQYQYKVNIDTINIGCTCVRPVPV